MYIDIFLGIFILVGVIQGYHRGVLRSLFAIAAIILGSLAALKFGPLVVSLFEEIFDWKPMTNLIFGLALTFLLIMFGIKWLGKSFEDTLRLVRLNILNKIAGAAMFALLMICIYGSILWMLDRSEVLSENQKTRSISYPYLALVPEYGQVAFESVKPVFKGFWDQLDAIVESGEGGQ